MLKPGRLSALSRQEAELSCSSMGGLFCRTCSSAVVQLQLILKLLIEADQAEAVELNQVGVVDPNQDLDTEGLEQEEEKAEESTGFCFL